MPWCPICKNEYKEGYTRCSECDIELVDSLEEGPVAIFFGEEDVVNHMSDFLTANKLEGAFTHYNEDDKTYELYVPRELEKEAKQKANVFVREIVRKEQASQLGVSEEELERMENEGFDSESVDENGEDIVSKAFHQEENDTIVTSYEDKSVKAEEYKSSAFALLIVGAVGMLFLVLLLLDILPIHLYGLSKYMIGIVMGLMFVVFLYMGVSSLRVHKKYLVIAEEEKALIESIKAYLKDNVTKEILDDLLCENGNLTNERIKVECSAESSEESKDDREADPQLYFKRTSIIKEKITVEFPDTEESLIEKLTDDWYSELYDVTETEDESEFDEEI